MHEDCPRPPCARLARPDRPIAFTIAWIVSEASAGRVQPRRDYISELAALDARHAWLMVTGFLLARRWHIVALGIGLAGALKGGLARIGSILVAFAGVGIIVAGLARVDCRSRLDACAARIDAGDVSWHSATHELVSLVLFLALVAAPLVLARAFSGERAMAGLQCLFDCHRGGGASAAGPVIQRCCRELERSSAAGVRDGTAAMDSDSRRAADPTRPHPATRARV